MSKLTNEKTLHQVMPLDDVRHGIKATIIDLGLARIDQGSSGIYFSPFDDETFEGEGDYQYDIYRMMRSHNDDSWEEFKPLSNVMVRDCLALRRTLSKSLIIFLSGCTTWQTS